MIYEYFNFSLFQFGLSLWNDLWIFFIFFSLFQFGCCGVGDGGYLDWSLNMYFNCSMGNPSVERCGVPFSCCINQNNVDVSGNTGINSLAPGKFEWNFRHNIQTDFSVWWLQDFLWNCPNMIVTGLHWWSVNIGSGNGLVPSGNKPLPEPMLTQISVTIRRH